MKKWMSFILVLLITSGALSLAGCNKEPVVAQPPAGVEEPVPEPEPAVQTVERVKPVTVVINNAPQARPHSGLQEASIIYEFLVEGGITRFLAVYDTLRDKDVTVGPVRSLRPYFAVQALEHGGAVAHSGYSDRTKEMIRGLGVKEITSATYLFRDNSRKAPHNLYTSMEKLYSARGASDVETEVVEESKLPGGGEEAYEIEVRYSGSNVVSYAYDAENGVYLRSINGKPHKDLVSGEQYHARRVIVRTAKTTDVRGTDLVDIDLDGSGQGWLYEAGRKYEIRWEKSGGKTRYSHKDGTAVDLRFHNTWIQMTR